MSTTEGDCRRIHRRLCEASGRSNCLGDQSTSLRGLSVLGFVMPRVFLGFQIFRVFGFLQYLDASIVARKGWIAAVVASLGQAKHGVCCCSEAPKALTFQLELHS